AGVVAHEMHGPEPAEGLVAQVPHRVEQRHVGRHADDVVVTGRELGDGSVEQRLVDVGQHHLHALGEEPLTQRAADPATATGDHGDLALQVLHGSTVTLVDRYT